jgi:hypothetical protein
VGCARTGSAAVDTAYPTTVRYLKSGLQGSVQD